MKKEGGPQFYPPDGQIGRESRIGIDGIEYYLPLLSPSIAPSIYFSTAAEKMNWSVADGREPGHIPSIRSIMVARLASIITVIFGFVEADV